MPESLADRVSDSEVEAPGKQGNSADVTAAVIAQLTARHMTLAVAESLTGGLLTAEFIRIPGASLVVNGGIVAYNTELKHTLLGVDAALLAAHGAVHPHVAIAMASGVRSCLTVDGRRADVGISTTGVAGPDSQDGQSPGTVFVGVSIGMHSVALDLQLVGDRESIRRQTVIRAVEAVNELIAEHLSE